MSLLQNDRLAVRVCQMYYLEDYSQKEIAELLHISRPQISRIIATARSRNLVSITVNDPFAIERSLEKQLAEHFALPEAMVFDSRSTEGLGRSAAQHIELYLSDANRIGVMSGRAIYSMAKALTTINRRGLEFVPLVGGIGSGNAVWHANSIAQNLAQKSGGTSYVMNAPLTVQSSLIRDALTQEPGISSVLRLGRECDVSLVGIGSINEDSTTMLAGAMTAQDIRELHQAGAVCAMCNSYLDKDGNLLDVPMIHRTVGQTLETVHSSRMIALAAGKNKVEAIKSALKSGFVDVLITDMDTAQNILENSH